MELREKLARILCQKNNIDPDKKTTPLSDKTATILGKEYSLWEFWAVNYVDPILSELDFD